MKRIITSLIIVALIIGCCPQICLRASAAEPGIGPRVLEGGKRDFAWPVPSSHYISGCFKDYRNHDAIDISAPEGTDVFASYDGVVYETGWGGGYGKYVMIEHNYKLSDNSTIVLYSKYNHLSSISVSEGQSVYRGSTVIGAVGHTGGNYGNHLDFQILTSPEWKNYNYHNVSIDPFVNDLLELTANLRSGSDTSCNCGAGATYNCCCQKYIDYVQEQYSHPLPNVCNHHYAPQQTGECTICHEVFDWQSTYDESCHNTGKVIKEDGFYPRISMPYDVASHVAHKLKKGISVTILGSYTNAYGNKWYYISYGSNSSKGYAYSAWIEPDPKPSDISINITWPYEGQIIPKQSHNLLGTVTSNSYPIVKVVGKLDGNQVSVVSTNTMQFNLMRSDIDYKMPFNTLSSGRHTITIIATDSNGGTQSLTRAFNTESSPCDAATVTTEDTANGKYVIMSCPGASINFTGSDDSSGSGTGTVRKFISSTTTFEITTSKSGYSNNVITRTVYVDQVQAPQFSVTPWYGGTKVTITSTPGAQIYYYYDGTIHGEYTGTFNETRNITVYAYAVKWGMRDSVTTSYTIQAAQPDTPTVQRFDTDEKIAIGKTASFRWNTDIRAQGYAVSLFKDGSLLNTVNQESNVYSCVLTEAGRYEVSVRALSPLGDSGDSAKVAVAAMDPSTVTFLDDDGSILAEYTVSYGDFVPRQNQPSHKGHYFSGWYPSNNYYEIPVTQDVTYTATYTPIEYDVIFYDVDGIKIGETQKIPYLQSATAPDYSSYVPDGYVFSGWTVIEASETDSACDFTCVDADLKLQAVIRWENAELPVLVKINSATVAPVGDDSVYTINTQLTNWPSATSNIYLVAVLKTEARNNDVVKTVCAERVQVTLAAGDTRNQPIELHYNGIAKNVEVFALERKPDGTTGSAYSKAVGAKVVFSTSWTNWSDWSTTRPEEQPGRTIESKTQYRYQDKETTTSSNNSLTGWTLYDSSWAWGPWGDWSSWSPSSQSSSDSVQVETRTEWRYYYFYCPVCGGHEPFQGLSDCHQYTLSGSDWHEDWFPTAYKYSNWHTYSYTSAKRWTESLGDAQRWNFSTGNTNDTAPGTVDSAGADVVIRTTYRYRTRNKVWTYYFYRWTEWSSWGDSAVTPSSTRNVETRTVYRYRDEVPIYDTGAGTEDTSGQNYRFTGSICPGEDLSGKRATIMVYQSKNMDPNQYQMQYVGQITIGEGNTYVVNFIPINQPSVESGNYIIALGVQGTTGLLSVDVLEAPKPEYTVRFLMDDGNVISTQTVVDGENAVVPDTPTKEGYRFTGWSERTTEIYKNVDIFAQFEKEQYLVAFVDWVNENIGFQKYYYGDTVTAPYTPSAEGHVFLGWDAILDGNTTVYDNMVVAAVYDKQQYTVRFLYPDGSVYQEQQIAYREAAVLPDAIEIEGKVFLGWSTDVPWWNVTSDLDVRPIVAYPETTVSPIANVDSFEIGMEIDIELASEAGATIYYTTDGTSPSRDSHVYNEPIHLMDTTIVSAMAVIDGKNDSEVVNVFFIHDETPAEEADLNVRSLDVKTVECVPDMSVPIEVEIQANPGLIGFTLILECDRSIYYIDVEDGDRIYTPGPTTKYGNFTVTPYKESGWAITWLSSYPSTSDGLLFSIPLRTGEEIEPGCYAIKLGYVTERIYTEEDEGVALYRSMVHFVGSDLSHEHEYTSVVTPPSCIEQGYATYTCSICGDSYNDDFIPALGHDYQNGVCIRCGQWDPSLNPFTDVEQEDYFFNPVMWAVNHNPQVTAGIDETHFGPNNDCTREQIVTFLWAANGKPEPEGMGSSFSDVLAGAWYYKPVQWAVEKGYTSGMGDGTFGVGQTCTRAQAMTFLWASKGKPDPSSTESPFTDVTRGDWFYNAILWAAENGVTSGIGDGLFGVNNTCTRAQIVTFLYKAYGA